MVTVMWPKLPSCASCAASCAVCFRPIPLIIPSHQISLRTVHYAIADVRSVQKFAGGEGAGTLNPKP